MVSGSEKEYRLNSLFLPFVPVPRAGVKVSLLWSVIKQGGTVNTLPSLFDLVAKAILGSFCPAQHNQHAAIDILRKGWPRFGFGCADYDCERKRKKIGELLHG